MPKQIFNFQNQKEDRAKSRKQGTRGEKGSSLLLTLFLNIFLDIHGDLTPSFEPVLSQAFQNGNGTDHTKILLKIDKDAYINSGGIAVLIRFLAQRHNNSQLVGLTGVSDHFRKIFKMVGITKFADIYDNVENGVEILSDTPCSRAVAC
jgi:anti-anti-sigma factor